MATKNGRFQLSQGALVIGFLSLLAVGSWIAFDLYRVAVQTTLPEVLQAQILPVETSIDQQTIDSLRQRQRIDGLTLSQVESVALEEREVVPTGAALPLQVTPTSAPATESGSIAPESNATESGQL